MCAIPSANKSQPRVVVMVQVKKVFGKYVLRENVAEFEAAGNIGHLPFSRF
jgi:hypothetical protein